jgi:hypothetical protein
MLNRVGVAVKRISGWRRQDLGVIASEAKQSVFPTVPVRRLEIASLRLQ